MGRGSNITIKEGTAGGVAVIGANGRTGALCVASCLQRGVPVRALTRTGKCTAKDDKNDNVQQTSPLLSVQACDARDFEALNAGVQGCRAVIYAASASKKGGKAKQVDNEAVVETGEACLQQGVGRYVVISSTATTRPKSLGYQFTNVYQNIMAEKRLGELGVIQSYERNNKQATSPLPCSYTILRPGGLEEPKRNDVLGPSALEFSQGDVLAGIISRADLAEVAVEAALSSSQNLQNTAFEVYYTESVQPCEGRFKTYLKGGSSGNGNLARINGDAYDALFEGLKPDGSHFVPA